MEIAVRTSDTQTMSSLDALWTLIQGQKKSVQKALAKRLNEAIAAEKEAKVKMTEKEFYAKLDRSIASTESGPIYTMGKDETGEEFINRLLSNAK
ncbi:MAG: hypothetical protein Q4E26_08675 [Prevotellaceae bacterium]|nr:hypothetical protein [Prevotellaceae bacterium]